MNVDESLHLTMSSGKNGVPMGEGRDVSLPVPETFLGLLNIADEVKSKFRL